MKRNLLIACCCLGWATGATGAPITLNECLQRADQRSSALKSFEMAAQAADESLIISRTSFYPTLKLRAAYSLADHPERLIITGNSIADRTPPHDVTLSTGDLDTYSIGLYLRQPLYTGGSLTQSQQRAEFQAEAARSDTIYQRSQVAQMVKKTFSEALAARMQVQALLKSLTGTKEQARVVQERLLEGDARREELLIANMEVSRAEAAWAKGENQAELTLTTLRNLINAEPNESIEPTGSLSKIHLNAPLSDLLTMGLQMRADLKSEQARVQQGSADIAIARSSYFPQVSLVGSYLRQPETATLRPDVWTIGAQAEWSLCEWGRTSAEVRRAAALAQQEVFRQDEARKDVLLEIEQFWRGMKDDEGQLRATEAQLVSLEYTLERLLNRYHEGLVKRSDILLMEAAFGNAYAAYVQSAANLHTTLASLERASGADLTPWMENSPLYEPDFAGITERINQAAHPKLQLSEPALAAPATVPVEKSVNPNP
jgi:outer membrane protein